ncbi:large ribosomal subunit protein bL21m [Silene latifolia]|uniref:large ribosomal subunit protein bL21m n=1 Tax=Silene latifolia TaxID=37657 RepID=UPI003D786A53
MACRRLLTTLKRHSSISFLSSSSTSTHYSQSLKTLIPSLSSLQHLPPNFQFYPLQFRLFSSQPPENPRINRTQILDEDDDDEDGDEDDDDEEDYSSAEEEEIDGNVGKRSVNEPARLEERSYYVEDKLLEAADIGYKVIGPLKPDDRVFKHYEAAFAIVQVGSHQFKVSNGDVIYVEKLKYCEVNDKLILKKVMMVGSPTQTIIGRPILPEAEVHAIVEEHALDAKVIIFKKKRRKNYRRTKGHRQELTRLRITNIQGVDKAEAPLLGKSSKTSAKKEEKVAVPA